MDVIVCATVKGPGKLCRQVCDGIKGTVSSDDSEGDAGKRQMDGETRMKRKKTRLGKERKKSMQDQEIQLTVSCDFHLICQYGGEEIECTKIYCHSHFPIQRKWRQGFPSLPIVPLSPQRWRERRIRSENEGEKSKVCGPWSHFNLFIFQGKLFPLAVFTGVLHAFYCVRCEREGDSRTSASNLIISLFSCLRESTDSSHVLYM